MELNRVLRPGAYFVWSATPVYRKDEENVEIWKGELSHNRHIFFVHLFDYFLYHSRSLVKIVVEQT